MRWPHAAPHHVAPRRTTALSLHRTAPHLQELGVKPAEQCAHALIPYDASQLSSQAAHGAAAGAAQLLARLQREERVGQNRGCQLPRKGGAGATQGSIGYKGMSWGMEMATRSRVAIVGAYGRQVYTFS